MTAMIPVWPATQSFTTQQNERAATQLDKILASFYLHFIITSGIRNTLRCSLLSIQYLSDYNISMKRVHVAEEG